MKDVALLVARLYLGLHFLVLGWAKVSGDPVFDGKPFPESFAEFVQNALDKGVAFHLWRPVLEGWIKPHAPVFAGIVGWTELSVGVSLLLGALVTFSAIGGIAVMTVNQLCSSPFRASIPLWLRFASVLVYVAVALLLTILAVHGAGRIYGLDRFILPERVPEGPLS